MSIILLNINHGTGIRNVKLRRVKIGLRHQNIRVANSRFRARIPGVCTVNSIRNTVRLTRITDCRNVVTTRGVIRNGTRITSCGTIPGYICAIPRITKINLARTRTGRGNCSIGINGTNFQTGNGTVTDNRRSNFIGIVVSTGCNRLLNLRVVNDRIASVVRRNIITLGLRTALSSLLNDVRTRPAVTRIILRTCRSTRNVTVRGTWLHLLVE